MHTDTFEIKSVSISDKALFDRYFAAFEPLNSEYTFTNMFMWRKSYNIRYAVIDGMLCIFSRHGENGTESVNDKKHTMQTGNISCVVCRDILGIDGLQNFDDYYR